MPRSADACCHGTPPECGGGDSLDDSSRLRVAATSPALPSSLAACRHSIGRYRVPERTRKAGGSTPKKRSIRRLVTSSYLAPPIPWMNRSPSAKRAAQRCQQRPRTDLDARIAQLQQLGDCGRGVAVGGKRQPRLPGLAIREHQIAVVLSAKQTPPPRIVGRPYPERRFQPRTVFRQLGPDAHALRR